MVLSRMPRGWAFVSLIAASMIAVAAYSAGDAGSTSGGSGLAGNFEISAYQGADLLGGSPVRLSDLVGSGKPVVLNFWAGLCPPCRAEMPFFQEPHAERGEEVLVVGVDIGPFFGLGSHDDGRRLLAEMGITYAAGSAPDAGVTSRWRIGGMPTTYSLLPGGQVHDLWTGAISRARLNQLINRLLDAS